MYSPIFLAVAFLSMGALAAPRAESATTAFQASRPSGVPGIFYTFTTAIPGPSNNGELGGGGAFTAGAGYGNAAGTLQGLGPTGPYAANGALGGGYNGASGVLEGDLSPTGASGCGGYADGSKGFTECITVPVAAATDAPKRR